MLTPEQHQWFEAYLRHECDEVELMYQLDVLQNKNKGDGVIYTPQSVVKEMIRLTVKSPEQTIIEPSCGHGAFLLGLLEWMRKEHQLSGESLWQWFRTKVTGVELSEVTVNTLKHIIQAYFKKHDHKEIEWDDLDHLHQGDGLTFSSQSSYDICLGNPPYIRAKHLKPDYLGFLKKEFKSCQKGTIDIYFAFIERYAHLAHEVCFITPNSFLTSQAGAVLRSLVSPKMSFLLDFKEKKVFPDASVYTCIFKLEKNRGDFYYGNDFGLMNREDADQFWLNQDRPKSQRKEVLSGIATLADKLFKVKKIKEGFWAEFNGQVYEIEKELVVPYLKLTKVKRQEDLERIDFMIYPYDVNLKIRSSEWIKTYCPKGWIYLNVIQNELLKRDKGKTQKYEQWYAYGRRQGLYSWTQSEWTIVPQMLGGQCKVFDLDLSSLLQEYSSLVFTSGFMIANQDSQKILCEGLKSQAFINFAKDQGKVWPGKEESFYSLTSHQIKKFNEDWVLTKDKKEENTALEVKETESD